MPRMSRFRSTGAVAARPAPTIRLIWPDPAEPRATLIHVTPGGREHKRALGPRTRLTLAQAAAVLGRSREGVQRSIRAGTLRTVRRNGRRYVTMQACRDFERERQADLAVIQARAHEPGISADEVYRELGM